MSLLPEQSRLNVSHDGEEGALELDYNQFMRVAGQCGAERLDELLQVTRVDDGVCEELQTIRKIDTDAKELRLDRSTRVIRPPHGSGLTFLIPDILEWLRVEETLTPAEARLQKALEDLSKHGLPSDPAIRQNHAENLCELLSTPGLHVTDPQWRERMAASLAYAEIFGERECRRFGRSLYEEWAKALGTPYPADVLIKLAYYRRHCGDTQGALDLSDCLQGRNYRHDLTDKQRSILATERAAALMDLVENGASGLMPEVKRFLGYSYAANRYADDEENRRAWSRYRRLIQEGRT